MSSQPRLALLSGRRELWLLALAAGLLAAGLLWRPIVHVRTHTLGPWDWLNSTTGYLAHEPLGCANAMLTDPVRQASPWARLAREELAQGRLPLWNERNGTGIPLLANYQSALLSPFTWPHYVLGLKLATLVSVFGRLVCAAVCSYLFLRGCAFSAPASAFGAVVYTVSAGHLMLMLHPHSAVTALLPLVLLCIERTIQAGERGERRALVRAGLGLAAAGGLSGLAGHPEMLLATALVGGLFALVRLAGSRAARRVPAVLALLGGAALAFTLAAPQILPFAEYLRVSLVGATPTRFVPEFDVRYLTLLFFPNLVGRGGAELAPGVITPNYQEQAAYYVGALPLLCAIAAPFLGALRTRFALFAALAPLIAVVVWNVGGLGELLGPYVSLGLIPVGRFYSLWTIAAAVLAAWLVERLGAGRSPRAAIVLGACTLALYAAALWGAAHFFSSYAAERGLDLARWKALAADHMLKIGATYWTGALALGALALARSDRGRWAAVGVLCLAQLAAVIGPVRKYVPISPDEVVLPHTPALETLRATVGQERVLFFGDGGIPADANAVLGVHSVTHYDALSIEDVQVAAAPFFGPQTYAAEAHKATLAGLRLFGVRYVSSSTAWLPIDTLSAQPAQEHKVSPYLELLRAAPGADVPSIEVDGVGVRQLLTAPGNGLAGLVVHFRADPEASSTPLAIALRDANGELVARRELELADLRDSDGGLLECVLGFPPIADSAGRSFAVRVRALDEARPRPRLFGVGQAWAQRLARAGLDPAAGAEQAFARGPEELRSGSRDASFVVDLEFGEAFADRGDIGGHSLFEVAGSRGRAWVVSGVLAAGGPAEALQMLMLDEFDPYQGVILQGFPDREPEPELDAALEPLHEDPQRSRWRARAERNAFLVVAQPHYPGWMARLDDQEVPLLRANYCFCAVALPRGEHEVELAYEPRSVKLGFALGALGWLALALAWLTTR